METKSPGTRVGAWLLKRVPTGLPFELKFGIFDGFGGEKLPMALCSSSKLPAWVKA
jgi:hypothetical protein